MCLTIFNEFFIEESLEFFWGVDDTGEAIYELSEDQRQIIKNSDLSKENLPNNQNNKTAKGKNSSVKDKSFNAVKQKLDQEEQLILEVQRREPLWNHTLPLDKRSRTITKKLWDEVSCAMKGSFTSDGAKKKFKSLKDTYRNMLRFEKCSSGSARKSTGEKWVHYHSMEFVRDYITPKETISNCKSNTQSTSKRGPAEVDEADLSDDVIEDDPVNQQSGRKPRKRPKSTADNEMLCESFDKVANAIATSSRQIVLPPLPSPPQVNEIDSCLNVIGCRLKKIPEMNQSEATQDMMTYSMEVFRRYSN